MVIACLGVPTANAGHELPFYPSYYPQQIRLETIAPAAAGPLFQKTALQAYVGTDPLANRRAPAEVGTIESLGAYLVLSFNTSAGAFTARESRCEGVLRIARALAPPQNRYVVHPYPITPYHADYLGHFDLAQARKKELESAAPARAGAAPKLRAKGPLAEALVGARKSDGAQWDATLEEVELQDLLAPHRAALTGLVGPPWVKQGWFHASLLQSSAVTDHAAGQAIAAMLRRLTAGEYRDLAEGLELERQLVSRLGAGCERVVLGYVPRRERFSAAFSEGIENVGWDSQAGFNSPIFVRTAKLKDFPWNGWLKLGIASKARAAWNPVAGFTDPAGRLVWAALGDPAMFPAPYSAGWVANRVTPAALAREAAVEVPEDAVVPEPGTGLPREVGKGKTARARIRYRVAASAFHDNTRMTPADAVYPYLFAARWGSKRPGTTEFDPAVEAATALQRQSLVAFKVIKVDSEVKKYSDMTFTYVVPVIEVYLNAAVADPGELAGIAPPWSPVPWHVLVLLEEAVKRGLAAFSPAEAARRGVPWLDLVRDPKVRESLAALADGFAKQTYVPEALKRWATADDAQTRWTALRQFFQRRGHFLVTNGPYQLGKWSEGVAVLEVFRDFTNPMGVGSFDRFANPRRAYVSRVVPRGSRLEVSVEVERVEKFLRDSRLVREPLSVAGPDKPEVPVCRYVVLDGAGAVVAAGASDELRGDRLVVDLKGRVNKPGSYTVMLALSLGDNQVNPEIAVTEYRLDASP